MSAPEAISEDTRPFRPYGAAETALYAKDSEVLLAGPAGTGKSHALLNKCFILAEKYPGCRGLFVRKTRASLAESGLVEWEQRVVPARHPILTAVSRGNRHSYRFPNGSEIVVAGMDNPTRIMSTQYDFAYVMEAIELSENDWESICTRLRHGKIPYQQLLADTNPDTPHHWLYQRCMRGATRLIESRHEDNPRFYDHAAGDWTPEGIAYLATLDALSGPRRARLRYGKWVAAEGQIFEDFDKGVHVVDRSALPKTFDYFLWSVDFGFTNPFCWQEWGVLDGSLYRLQEIYRTGVLVEDHAKRIQTLSKTRPQAVICDHDAEGRATLERYLNVRTIAAKKSVLEGIQEVQSRLRPGEDGKPRIYFVKDGRVDLDRSLREASKPTCTEEEFDSYVWNPSLRKGEAPLKENDHGMDPTRYVCMYLGSGGKKRSNIQGRKGAWM